MGLTSEGRSGGRKGSEAQAVTLGETGKEKLGDTTQLQGSEAVTAKGSRGTEEGGVFGFPQPPTTALEDHKHSFIKNDGQPASGLK